MIYPDTETRRQLVRERQAELERETWLDSLERPVAVDASSRRRVQLRRLRLRLHLARQAS